VSPPHDVLLQQMGLKAIAGPPEVGVPSSGLFASDRLLKENPQILGRTLRALLRANRFIEENRQEIIRIMAQAVPQSPEAGGAILRRGAQSPRQRWPDDRRRNGEPDGKIER